VTSWVNLVEVYYRIERDHGRDQADQALTELWATLSPDLPGSARMIEGARLKTGASIALADCFADVTAAAHSAPLLTGDPELSDLRVRSKICARRADGPHSAAAAARSARPTAASVLARSPVASRSSSAPRSRFSITPTSPPRTDVRWMTVSLGR
jgi:hypothetical protein